MAACRKEQEASSENNTTLSTERLGTNKTSEINWLTSKTTETSSIASVALEEEAPLMSDFVEQAKVIEVTDFSGTLEVIEDHSNKRIIFWKEEEVIRYKSVYLKNKQTVKIIEADQKGQIYYGGL